MNPIDAALALHAALAAGRHGEQLRDLFAPDATATEYPNAISPGVAIRGLEEVLTASAAGAALLARQSFDVHSAIAVGDTAIIRLTWSAEVAREAGRFAAGQRLTAHIAQFVRVEGGRIAELATYDCYEPFD